jgi:hypothetical protein
MQVFNIILLSFIAVTTSLTCLLFLMRERQDSKDKSHLLKQSKLETINRISQDFNSSCNDLLEIANTLRSKLGKIERISRNKALNPDTKDEKNILQQETLSAQSLVEKLRRLYIEVYLPASVELLTQTSDASSIKDQELCKMFNELVLLDERLKETWRNLDRMDVIEKVKVLLGQFNRTSNYLYLLRETSQQVVDRTVYLENKG